jgi:hypothetical protein
VVSVHRRWQILTDVVFCDFLCGSLTGWPPRVRWYLSLCFAQTSEWAHRRPLGPTTGKDDRLPWDSCTKMQSFLQIGLLGLGRSHSCFSHGSCLFVHRTSYFDIFVQVPGRKGKYRLILKAEWDTLFKTPQQWTERSPGDLMGLLKRCPWQSWDCHCFWWEKEKDLNLRHTNECDS